MTKCCFSRNIFKSLNVFSVGIFMLPLTGCMPMFVAGTGVATVTNAAKEKGLSGAMSDTQIKAAIKATMYQKDQEFHKRVDVAVQNGEVLLTGDLEKEEHIYTVEQIAWGTRGVKHVMNHLTVDEADSLKISQNVSDSWLSTQLKSALVFDEKVRSINYTIKVVDGTVYVMGLAHDEEELSKVLETLRKTGGVKKVINYAKVRDKCGEDSEDSLIDAPAAEPLLEDDVNA